MRNAGAAINLLMSDDDDDITHVQHPLTVGQVGGKKFQGIE